LKKGERRKKRVLAPFLGPFSLAMNKNSLFAAGNNIRLVQDAALAKLPPQPKNR
jgi:hypothetical protein